MKTKPSKLTMTIGIVIIVIAAAGLLLASGNLISLPMLQSQLAKAAPDMEDAIAEAVAQSRRKSYYGIALCSPLLVVGLGILLSQSRRPLKPDSP